MNVPDFCVGPGLTSTPVAGLVMDTAIAMAIAGRLLTLDGLSMKFQGGRKIRNLVARKQ